MTGKLGDILFTAKRGTLRRTKQGNDMFCKVRVLPPDCQIKISGVLFTPNKVKMLLIL